MIKNVLIIVAAILVIGGAVFLVAGDNNSSEGTSNDTALSFADITNDINAGGQLIDVRTASEFAEGHIDGAINLPLQEIQDGQFPDVSKDKPVYVYCRSGNRSAQASEILITAGYQNVIDLGAIQDVEEIGGKVVVGSSQNNNQQTATNDSAQLTYLIEEEKLAHDVYLVMYQKYGSKIFNNILSSELTHQNKVLTLLESRKIADPRSQDLGVFQDQELQALYNQLIEQGNQSLADAFKVGVAIEERDISDLQEQLNTTTDNDIKTTLESLLGASQNHLKAFSGQV